MAVFLFSSLTSLMLKSRFVRGKFSEIVSGINLVAGAD